MPDETFYDNSSGALGLSHCATAAQEVLKCDLCGTTMLTEDAGGHTCSPLFNSRQNPDLGDPRWNEHNNRAIDAEARARGETMPVAIEKREDRKRLVVNYGAYDEIEKRIRELQAEGKTLLEAVHTAYNEAKSSDTQREAEPVERDDYLGASLEELMDANKRIGGHGGRRSGGRFKNQKPVKGDTKRQRRYDEILSDERFEKSDERGAA